MNNILHSNIDIFKSIIICIVIFVIDNSRCEGRIHYPFKHDVKTITMIAVGVGLAPMIQTLRTIFKDHDERISNSNNIVEVEMETVVEPLKIVLLYGVVCNKIDIVVNILIYLYIYYYYIANSGGYTNERVIGCLAG